MDELGMLVSLLDEDPSAHGERDGRRRLTGAIDKEATQARRRFAFRPRFALFGGFGLAGAAAALAGAVLLSSGTTPRAPDPVRPASTPAARLMLAAAHSVESGPAASSGRYWEVQRQRGGRLVEDGKSYDFVQRLGGYDAGPGRDAWSTMRMVSKRYAGPTSEQGAGSSLWDTFRWSKVRASGGQTYQILQGSKDPVDVRRLPDTAPALKSYLDKLLHERSQGWDPTEWLYGNAEDILASPVGPRVRGAVYRLLAADPHLRAVGTVKDPLGRPGTAFSRRTSGAGMVTDDQLIVDTRTGRLLATRTVLVQPGPAWPGKKPGDIASYEAVLSYGWTDQIPNYPPLP
ncbi:CU044_5270 family protein [Actinomadura rupiterrae]|uniref:CU044_5270 family protein n=1 Tax=Actinomadura rupiterrae TaxID=559627 RepID=UPI0020A33EDF|nr:CU044_5270 family protein [Actinomadura rupiterrae]MCP2337756.1 hypothetical protein [Actinomadura rupiterrae]